MRNAVLLLSLFSLSWALAAPSKSHVPSADEAGELLEAVCPGANSLSDQGTSCDVCPDFVGGGGDGPFNLRSVIYGRFLAPGETDAVLDFDGCEAHVNNFGGTVILRWKGLTHWELVRYEPGSRTSDCQKIAAKDRHDLLMCGVGYSNQGYIIDGLSLLDLRRKANWTPVLVLSANTGTCDNKLYQLEIGSWMLRPPQLVIQVKEAQWQRPKESCEAQPPKGAVKTHRLEYRFDGSRFVPTPQTARLAKRLEAVGR